MCGITGFLCAAQLDETFVSEAIRRMTQTLRHRGPDAEGIWQDVSAGVALGHRRLSVVDLSAEGDQPMVSASGRYVVTFNGEIYNHVQVRKELEGQNALLVPWRGHSDTEVMLAAIEAWGLKRALHAFAGMFAFALWDKRERLLYLVRDRLGEKPLYYGHSGPTLLFGSELKAFKAYPNFRGTVNRSALALLMKLGYVPAPYSIYDGIYKLAPGTILCVAADGTHARQICPPDPYWRAREVAEAGAARPYSGSDEDAVGELTALLRNAVAGQSVADVPLGAFLSGGIDSSLIVALMQAAGPARVKTFTIGFAEKQYDEAVYARAVAQLLGTDHTELYVSPNDAMAIIPRLPTLYDEPFSDPSQIPTFLVSQLARQHVTVSLSGDGGDELFGGYSRYRIAPKIWNSARLVPRPARVALADVINATPPWVWDTGVDWIRGLWESDGQAARLSDRLRTLAHLMPADSFESLYVRTTCSRLELVDADSPQEDKIMELAGSALADSHASSMMFRDMLTYLPDDILVKVDRAAMGVSLETRMPFLDHRVVEFAWQLPSTMKVRGEEGKWILKQVLAKYLPQRLVERRKMGFSIPLDKWLRGPLREWAEDLLDENRMRSGGYLRTGVVRRLWEDHVLKGSNRQLDVWNVLMFQAWLSQS